MKDQRLNRCLPDGLQPPLKNSYTMKRSLDDIINALLIFLWIYAACSKLLDYSAFKEQLALSPLAAHYAGIISIVLPVIEILTALLLTIKSTRIYGLLASLILLIVFSGYIAGMFLSSTHLPCSCGGAINGLSWKEHLVVSLFFLAITVIACVMDKKQRADKQQTERSSLIKKYFVRIRKEAENL